eukprot:scaffold1902_cov16-Tisochrysis_lutea.AAC.1
MLWHKPDPRKERSGEQGANLAHVRVSETAPPHQLNATRQRRHILGSKTCFALKAVKKQQPFTDATFWEARHVLH